MSQGSRPDEHMLRRELRDGAGTCISSGLSAVIRGAPLRDAIAYAAQVLIAAIPRPTIRG
jgi:hypothetical protein